MLEQSTLAFNFFNPLLTVFARVKLGLVSATLLAVVLIAILLTATFSTVLSGCVGFDSIFCLRICSPFNLGMDLERSLRPGDNELVTTKLC